MLEDVDEATRIRRARSWLTVGFAGHGATLGIATSAIVLGQVQPVVWAVAIGVFAVAPTLIAGWREWKRPSTRRPFSWPARAASAACPQALASGALSVSLGLGWTTATLLGALTIAVQVGAAHRAQKDLSRPLRPWMADIDMDIRVRLRSERRIEPGWLSPHSAVLTDSEIIVTAQFGFTAVFAMYIPLAFVREVTVEYSTTFGAPWFTTTEGWSQFAAPGPVVVVRYQGGEQTLPIDDAQVFAGLVRLRVENAMAAATAAQ